jgi:hypothetical protein
MRARVLNARVQCFSVGAEEGTHLNSHDYRVIDNMTFPLFDPDWGGNDELQLLAAIESKGSVATILLRRRVQCETPHSHPQ